MARDKKAVLKQSSEKVRERTCFPKVSSLPLVVFSHRPTCRGELQSTGSLLIRCSNACKLPEQGRQRDSGCCQESSRLPARPRHTYRAGKEKKPRPQTKMLSCIMCAHLPSAAASSALLWTWRKACWSLQLINLFTWPGATVCIADLSKTTAPMI